MLVSQFVNAKEVDPRIERYKGRVMQWRGNDLIVLQERQEKPDDLIAGRQVEARWKW
jgi:hypothetical protein